MIPAEDTSNDKAQVFEILWKDSASLILDDSKNTVILGGQDKAKARFVEVDDYIAFKELFEKFGPHKEPFRGLNRSFIARQSTARTLTSKTATQMEADD